MKQTNLNYNTVDHIIGLDLGARIVYKDGTSTFTNNSEMAFELKQGDTVGFDTHGRVWLKVGN